MYTWEELTNFVTQCRRCPLCNTRTCAVMGKGNHNASVLFIAEAPGAQENLSGIPFVGPSGKVFDELLSSVGLNRDDIYLTNIIKCHPPYNRDPAPEEQEACMPYLKYETFLLKPKIIVCLGRIAAQRILAPDFRITRQHGTWIERKNCFLTAVYHPSAILRDPSRMEEAKQDFLKIRRKLDFLTTSLPSSHS